MHLSLLDTYGFQADLLAVIDVVDGEGIWLAANYEGIPVVRQCPKREIQDGYPLYL